MTPTKIEAAFFDVDNTILRGSSSFLFGKAAFKRGFFSRQDFWRFAWQQARELYTDASLEADGSKHYRVHGTLFFASVTTFLNQFSPSDDPAEVTLDCAHLRVVDYSAIAAIKTLRERYAKAGKHLRVVHLTERCKQLLKRAGVQHG